MREDSLERSRTLRCEQINAGSPKRFSLAAAVWLKCCFCVPLILGLIFSATRVHSEPTSARIGFVLPLSGDWAFLGNGIRDGALLAQQDLKSRGQYVELIFADNRGDLPLSATTGKQLIEIKKVDAIVSIISGVGRILKPLVVQAGVIQIGICSEVEVADGKNNFLNYLTAAQGASKFLEQLGQGKSIGIFAQNESGFQRLVEEIRRNAPTNVNILFEENFNKGITDFRPMLLRRAKFRPDTLLILGLSPEIEILVSQARSLGITTPVSSIEGFGLANDKSQFEGAWYVDAAVPNSEFQTRFSKVYGREVTPGVGHSYDSVMLLAEAFRIAASGRGGSDRESAISIFRHLRNFPGVTGKLDVREDGVIWSDASVKIIRKGRAELLGK